MKESVHLGTKFMNLSLRSVPLFIISSSENGVCDHAYLLGRILEQQVWRKESKAGKEGMHIQKDI